MELEVSHAVAGESRSAGAGEMLIAGSRVEHAALAAELMARAILEATQKRGVARVALSGGSTPADAYRHLASLDLPWSQIEWFWVDERAVPPDHERSNYTSARRDLLLDRAEIPADRVHRMEGEDEDLGAAAERYERLLRRTFGVASAVSFDVMTLGVGDDGHTASLFPNTGGVLVEDRLVLAVAAQPEKGLEARLTLTSPVLCEAALALVLVRGATKRNVVAKARSGGPEDDVPSRVFRRIKGRLVWLLDHDATG